jgi:hypothetical protein
VTFSPGALGSEGLEGVEAERQLAQGPADMHRPRLPWCHPADLQALISPTFSATVPVLATAAASKKKYVAYIRMAARSLNPRSRRDKHKVVRDRGSN